MGSLDSMSPGLWWGTVGRASGVQEGDGARRRKQRAGDRLDTAAGGGRVLGIPWKVLHRCAQIRQVCHARAHGCISGKRTEAQRFCNAQACPKTGRPAVRAGWEATDGTTTAHLALPDRRPGARHTASWDAGGLWPSPRVLDPSRGQTPLENRGLRSLAVLEEPVSEHSLAASRASLEGELQRPCAPRPSPGPGLAQALALLLRSASRQRSSL